MPGYGDATGIVRHKLLTFLVKKDMSSTKRFDLTYRNGLNTLNCEIELREKKISRSCMILIFITFLNFHLLKEEKRLKDEHS